MKTKDILDKLYKDAWHSKYLCRMKKLNQLTFNDLL
jgi:hypothetical protein